MPTNDERREVAAYMQERASIERNPDLAHLLLTAAKLIEPEPERTCHIDNEHAFGCAINGAIYITRFSCGHFMENSVLKNEINFCPTCGAKVVNE